MNWLKVLFCTLALVGCQTTTKLEPTNGNGALLIPIAMNIKATNKRYPCRKIGLMFESGEQQFELNPQKIEGTRYSGYGLINNLKPGTYESLEFRCYAEVGTTLSGGKEYTTHGAYLKYEISPNQLLISQKAFIGTYRGSMRSLWYGAYFKVPTDQQLTEAKDIFFEEPIDMKWYVKQQ